MSRRHDDDRPPEGCRITAAGTAWGMLVLGGVLGPAGAALAAVPLAIKLTLAAGKGAAGLAGKGASAALAAARERARRRAIERAARDQEAREARAEAERIKNLPKPLSRSERVALANQDHAELRQALQASGLPPPVLQAALLEAERGHLRRLDQEMKR